MRIGQRLGFSIFLYDAGTGPTFPIVLKRLGGIYMRGMLLWLIGIPIPIIILLYLFGVM